ncbi:type I-E CRISPR-associated protein Cas5/CasD [Saccharomonospora halophila]|uniref:type I-E CRISPR-associated protein Cas5/CasD n=1 Tax=Saccharomonospora halophila TaxID=129922 RepID=UPI00037D33D1|nr:type I-E CRISPR-associated protein Cas5/CasD [Saccharomonospora halophila]
MTVLTLRLAAPLQAWGTSSRFTRRNTDRVPSKSGVVGLLAAALGRQRTDDLDDLRALRLGVRVEQPGRLERDFQTARPRDGSKPLPLSYRFYLADAVFLAVLDGDPELLASARDALRRPHFPLYLGRRSCPPTGPLVLGMGDGDLDRALTDTGWQASAAVAGRRHERSVTLTTVTDCPAEEPGAVLVRDEPLSFDPRHRRYGWRSVSWGAVTVDNPHFTPSHDDRAEQDHHEPLTPLSGEG